MKPCHKNPSWEKKTRHTKEGATSTSDAAGEKIWTSLPWPCTVTSTVVGEPATGSQKPGQGKSARLGHPCTRIFTTGAIL